MSETIELTRFLDAVANAIDEQLQAGRGTTQRAEAAVLAVLTAMAAWSRGEGCTCDNPDPEFFEDGLAGFARTHGFESVYVQAVSGVWELAGFGRARETEPPGPRPAP